MTAGCARRMLSPGQKGAGSVRCLRCRSVGMVSGPRSSPPRLAREADPGREERGLGWLIFWLFALLAGLAMFIEDLLGPSEPPTVRVLPPPAPRPQKDDEPRPAPQPQDDEPPPVPAALSAAEGGWLETQLALITAWSERMQKQIASSQADPGPWRCLAITTKEDEPRPARQPQEDEPPPVPAALPAAEGGWLETQLALITAWSERMRKQIASSQADPDPWRCIAITAKRSQCKLLAEPGDTKCAIHGGHPDRLPVAQCAGHCRGASHLHQPGGLISRAISWPNYDGWRAGR
jgi:hypothetical protein